MSWSNLDLVEQQLPTAARSWSGDSDAPFESAKEPSAIRASSGSRVDSFPEKELAEHDTGMISEVIVDHCIPAPSSSSCPSHPQQDWHASLPAGADQVQISGALEDERSPDWSINSRPGLQTKATVAPASAIQVAPTSTTVHALTPLASASSIGSNGDKRQAGSSSTRWRTAKLTTVAEVVDPTLPVQRLASTDVCAAFSPLPTPLLQEAQMAKLISDRYNKGNHIAFQSRPPYPDLVSENNHSRGQDSGSGVGSAVFESRVDPSNDVVTCQPRSMEAKEPPSPPESVTSAESTPQLTRVLEAPHEYVYGPPQTRLSESAVSYRWEVMQIAYTPTTDSGGTHESVMITKERPSYERLLDITTFEPGWYWIVLHLERSPYLGRQMMKNLTINVKQLDANGGETNMSKICKTKFDDFDLDNFFDEGHSLSRYVRLHRQIEINSQDSSGNDLQLTVESDIQTDYVDDHLQVHSIQMTRGLPDNSHLIVYGEGRPHDIIHIPQKKLSDGVPRVTSIHSFSISKSRTHAATLSFGEGNVHIQVWDLQKPTSFNGDRFSPQEENNYRPREHNMPKADTGFKWTSRSELKDICFQISNSGEQVTLHSVESGFSDHGIPFCLFQYAVKRPAVNGVSGNLVPVMTLASGLNNFFGYGCFHSQDEDLNSKERYITCEGTRIRLYSTMSEKGKWDLLYTLHLCLEPNIDAALRLHLSLRGQYFAWTGSKEVVTIWDIETGRYISNIATPTEDNADVFVNFSRLGKKVAISASGKITVHQTHSGVLLGEYSSMGLNEDSLYEVDFDEDFFMAIDQAASAAAKEKQESISSCRRIVDTRSKMTVQRTCWVHRDYRLQGASGKRVPLFACGQGSTLSLFSLPDPIAPTTGYRRHPNCSTEDVSVNRYMGTMAHTVQSDEKVGFQISSSQLKIRGVWSTVLEISRTDDSSKSKMIPLGPAISAYHGIFVAKTAHLIVIVGCFLQRWRLLVTGLDVCILDLVRKIQDDSKHPKEICFRDIVRSTFCSQGQEVNLHLAPPQWFRLYRPIEDESKNKAQQRHQPGHQQMTDIITVPLEHDANFLPSENCEIQGIVGAVTMYTEGDEFMKRCVIRYLKSLVRQSQENHTSSIVYLCKSWTPERRVSIESISSKLLSLKYISWVPDTLVSKKNDPLSILMEITKRQPNAIGAARILLDYCVHHAISSRNLSFLFPLFLSIHEFMNLFPEDASDYLLRTAFIPVQQRSFIIDNHRVIRPPKMFHIPFLKEKPVTLHADIKDPILQLVVTPPRERVAANDTFTRPVFMTSFDALWTKLDYKEDVQSTRSGQSLNASRIPTFNSPGTDVPIAKTNYEDYWAKRERRPEGSNWIKTAFHIIGYKCQFRSRTYVETHKFQSLEYFDNPAIAALVAYKWNTIGYSYWFFRFMSQCIFYALVYFAALFQVYNRENPNQPIGHYIAILVIGAGFLWLELLQMIKNPVRYSKSRYNLLDLAAYGLPMIASIDQIIVHQSDDVQGNTRILSFSILVIFFHMLFEARVHEGICKYVTIIQNTILEIKVFLVIFAAGLLGFAVAILHLMHGRYPMGNYNPSVDDVGTSYPYNFLGAISATYFFMGGIYDSVSDNFAGDDWAFHFMMALFFFFTVILMLNVLIALINVAFIKGGDGWCVWMESRLQYIESAENMSYHLPGFRDAHDQYFPQVIYFTATWKEVKDHRLKYEKKKKEGAALAEMTKHLYMNEQGAPVQVSTGVLDAATADDTREPLESLGASSGSRSPVMGEDRKKGDEKAMVEEEASIKTTMESMLAQMEALKMMMKETQDMNHALASKILSIDFDSTS